MIPLRVVIVMLAVEFLAGAALGIAVGYGFGGRNEARRASQKRGESV